MANAKPKYYLVEATALPEVFVKVTEAKSLLETGEARTVAEAVERVGTLSYDGIHLTHLCDAACVIGYGAVGVGRKGDAES